MKDYGTIQSLLHFNGDLTDEVSSETWNFAGSAFCSHMEQTSLGANMWPVFDPSDNNQDEQYVCFSGNDSNYVYCNNTSGIFNLHSAFDYELEAFIRYKGYIAVSEGPSGITRTITGAGKIFSLGDLELEINSSAQFTLLGETSTATITGEWQHILLRLNEGTIKIFLDGTEIISTVFGQNHYLPSIVKLGGYNGVMDEFVFRHSIGATPPVIPTSAYDGTEIRQTVIEDGILKLAGVIQLRGGTAAVLASENPSLSRREIMCEVDTGKIKVGDGVHNWNDLAYAGGSSLEVPASDDTAYVVKNGAYVPVVQVDAPSSWEPTIDAVDPIILTVDEDMTPYQLTGTNVEVSE